MSFWDAAIGIGISVVGGVLSGDAKSQGSESKQAMPPLDNSKFMSKGGSKLTHSQRRGNDPTKRAETIKEKAEENNDTSAEAPQGDSAVALAKMWNEVMSNE